MKAFSGRVRVGRRTKELVKRLRPGDMALLNHRDLDRVAAQALLRIPVKAVLNAQPSISGRYPASGTDLLLERGIPVVDGLGEGLLDLLRDGDWVTVDEEGRVWQQGKLLAQGRWVTRELLAEERHRYQARFQEEFTAFLQNTLSYARKEKDVLLRDIPFPPPRVPLAGRPCLVVVRGLDVPEDLQMLAPFIRYEKPVLLAVDGGADALLEQGYRPDIIVGDMDSVSDEALRKARQIIVHAYPDGRAPGWARVEALGLSADRVAMPGTSEDLGLLYAYQMGARLLVLVGSHSSFVDFMEKDRPGMASTLITRLKVGHLLVDAKGVHQLYRAPGPGRTLWAAVVAAALLPLALLAGASPLFRGLLAPLYFKLRFWLGL
ncbi:MAG: hypothetical protein KM310_06035 [Clostridiales bacterium]|nr:hypothetical protein [Clostridiales bacterium]